MKACPVIRNGIWLGDPEKAIPAWDRSFHFGDGFFETFRVMEGRVPFFERHFQRAQRAAQSLGIIPPGEMERKEILEDVHRLLDHVGVRNARMRLTFSRSGGAAYTPREDTADRLLELTSFCGARFDLPERGDRIGVYEGAFKHPGPLAFFKSTSASLYVMAQRYAKSTGLDEALIRSTGGKLIEAASSNIFLIMEDEICTPPLSDGCVDGIMREVLLELARKRGWVVRECSLGEAELLKAEEIVLSNAVQGIRPVQSFQDKHYPQKKGAVDLLQELNEQALS